MRRHRPAPSRSSAPSRARSGPIAGAWALLVLCGCLGGSRADLGDAAIPTTPAHAEAASPAEPKAPAGAVAPAGPAAPDQAPATASPPVAPRPGEWPTWGGTPYRNMVNTVDRGIPTSWDPKTKKGILWTAALGSQTYGNPTIADGRVFVGTNNGGERNPKIKGDKGNLMCFQASDGQLLWQAVHDKLESGRVNDWPEQGICSAVCVDGPRVYYVSNRAEVVCADVEGFLDGENDGPYKDEKYTDPIDGDFIWVLDMMEDLGVFPHNLATSSPLLIGDRIFVITSNGVEKDHITIPSPRAPSFIAIHKMTGELLWESDAPGEKILHGQWSSPGYVEVDGKGQILFPGGDGWLRSYEPETGKVIWEFDCNPKDSVWVLGGRGTRNNLISTPVSVGATVYIAVGQDPEHGEGIGHLYAIDARKTGDITESGRLWHYGDKEYRRTISTVAVKDGLVYAADLSGFLHCLDEKTGRPYWVHDMLAAVWGSPTWIDGHIYMGDEDGDVTILKAGKTLQVVSEVNMENSVYSTPVAAGGVLYISNRTHLFAISAKAAGQ